MHLYISGVLNQLALEPTRLAAIAEGCDHNDTATHEARGILIPNERRVKLG
jgi:hypothetical protein